MLGQKGLQARSKGWLVVQAKVCVEGVALPYVGVCTSFRKKKCLSLSKQQSPLFGPTPTF